MITDVFSRMIVGWRVAPHMRTGMVLDAIEMARWSRGTQLEGLRCHSDAGSQFTSIRYGERLAELGAMGQAIGAIVENPAAPALAEFTFARLPDGSVQYERATTAGLSLRKHFNFPATQDQKDNYVAEMQFDFRNDDASPHSAHDYFIALGSTSRTGAP